jgi:hypothetical protein
MTQDGFKLMQEKIDHIIAILEERAVNAVIPDNWRNWNSVLGGCTYDGGTLEADYTEQGYWRIKYIKGDYTQPLYVPNHIHSENIESWWTENQEAFMKSAQESIEAYKAIQ